MKRLVAASFALFAVSCATMRVYQLPPRDRISRERGQLTTDPPGT